MAKPKADSLGIAEGDVNRLIDEYRREKHKPKAFKKTTK